MKKTGQFKIMKKRELKMKISNRIEAFKSRSAAQARLDQAFIQSQKDKTAARASRLKNITQKRGVA